MKKSILSFLLVGKNRHRVLQCLEENKSEGEIMSYKIEKYTELPKSHISKALKELNEYGLVKCTNDEDRKFKFYMITPKGQRVLKQVNKLVEDIKKE